MVSSRATTLRPSPTRTSIDVQPDVLYVDNGSVLTSAGSAAGIDLCLHLIRRDYGAEIANHVARRLVVPPHRHGGQAQFIDVNVRADRGDSLSGVLDWGTPAVAGGCCCHRPRVRRSE